MKDSDLLPNHVRPKTKGKLYFCKLCRSYTVKNRSAHLIAVHKADPEAVRRRHYKNLKNEIFVEGKY